MMAPTRSVACPERVIKQVRIAVSGLRLRVSEQRADHRQREAGAGEQAGVSVPKSCTRTPVMPAALQIFGQGFLRSTRCPPVPAPGNTKLGIVGALWRECRQQLERRRRQRDAVLGLLLRRVARLGPDALLEVEVGPTWRRAPRPAAPVSSSSRTMFAACWSSYSARAAVRRASSSALR